MNHMYNSLFFCFCLIFSGLVSAQSYSVEWFEQHKVDYSYSLDDYFLGDNETFYSIQTIPSSLTSSAGQSKYLARRLNEQLEIVQEVAIKFNPTGKEFQYGKRNELLSSTYTPEGIVLIGYNYDSEAKEVKFLRSVLDLTTLEQSQPFYQIHLIENVDLDNVYHIQADQPNYEEFILIHAIWVNQDYSTPTMVNFILSVEGEVLLEITPPEEGMYFVTIDNEKQFHFLEEFQANQAPKHTTVHAETGEIAHYELSLESSYRSILSNDGTVYSFSFFNDPSSMGFEIFSPSVMETPVMITVPNEKLELFAEEKVRESKFWPVFEEEIIEIYQKDDGNFIITLEYYEDNISGYGSIKSTGNIVSVCFDKLGNIIWMQHIPKFQHESPEKSVSILPFRTTEGLHLLYNDGSNNLERSQNEKHVTFGNMGAGEDIITLAKIDNDGNTSREEFYNLTEDKMWLDVRDSKRVSERLFILNLDYKRKEKLGVFRIE